MALTEQRWPADARELADIQRFNSKLKWMPRFRIRNRIAPTLLQALLRVGQVGGGAKLARHGLSVHTRYVTTPEGRVPLRIVQPKGPVKGVVLDFHGGGWVIGNAQMNDHLNSAMVRDCDVAVVSVDYRLATHTPIQGLLADCLAAARWLLSDQTALFKGLPVIVVGESAGGHLAAATLLALKSSPELLQRVKGAVLYYGVYDLTGTPSVRNAGPDTLVLDGPGMVDALRLLTPGLTDEQRQKPPLSPLYGDLSGLPPALMFAGELDPLRDDTFEMARRWGVVADVEANLLPQGPHGVVQFPTVMGKRVTAYARRWINQRLA